MVALYGKRFFFTLGLYIPFIVHGVANSTERQFQKDSLAQEKILLIGERHDKDNNDIYLSVLQSLNKMDIYPKTIADEAGYGYTYILDVYLKTGNKELLQYLTPVHAEQQRLEKMKAYYDGLDPSKKFMFVGVDFERSDRFTYGALSLIIQGSDFFKRQASERYDKYDAAFSDFIYNKFYVVGSKELQKQPVSAYNSSLSEIQGKVKDFYSFYCLDSLGLKEILKDHFQELRLVFASYQKKNEFQSINFDRASEKDWLAREIFMAGNLYTAFKKDPTSYLLGRFGFHHVEWRRLEPSKNMGEYKNLAKMLKYEPDYKAANSNVKIFLIVYSEMNTKYYKDFGLTPEQLTRLKTKKRDQGILIEKPMDTNQADYIIIN